MIWKEYSRGVHKLTISVRRVGYVIKRTAGGGAWWALAIYPRKTSLGTFDSLAIAKKAVEDSWCSTDVEEAA